MAYEVTVRCDCGKGNPLTKEQCQTYARDQRYVPRSEAPTSRAAIHAAEVMARARGWTQVRKVARPVGWICKVCQDAGGP